MKKSFLLLIIGCLLSIILFAQQVPTEITFHYLQVSTTFGKEHNQFDPKERCITFKKISGGIISVICNSKEEDVKYTISSIQNEKKQTDHYSITFSGYQYYPTGPILAFLTYNYSQETGKWSISIETVLDNDQEGIGRLLYHYFNIN